MSKRFKSCAPEGREKPARGGGGPRGTATASVFGTRLADTLAVQQPRLVSSAVYQPGGSQSQLSKPRVLPPPHQTRSFLRRGGTEKGNLKLGVWVSGSQVLLGNRVWKAAGGARWGGPLEDPPTLLQAVEEDHGSSFCASPLRSGTEPVSLTVASIASSIRSASVAVSSFRGRAGGRKERLQQGLFGSGWVRQGSNKTGE